MTLLMRDVVGVVVAVLLGVVLAIWGISASADTEDSRVRDAQRERSAEIRGTVDAAIEDNDAFDVPGVPSTHADLSPDVEDTIDAALRGDIPTSKIGPHIKCVEIAPRGWPLPQYTTECPPPSATTTPPGGGSTTTPTTTPEGPGNTGGGGDSSSPSDEVSNSGGGGGNGGGGGGGSNNGEVLGAASPDMPNTGLGGDTAVTLASLLLSALVACVGAAVALRKSDQHLFG